MPDYSDYRDTINTALLHLGGKYVCLRHLAAVPENLRLEFASRVMFENAVDVDTVRRTLKTLGLFDEKSPDFCGNLNGENLIERYILKDPAYRCSVHTEKMLGKGCVSCFCNCCTCHKNEARTEMERYLTQVYYHSPKLFELDPKTVASKLCCCEVFSCIGDDKKCRYIEIPVYQALLSAIFQLREEKRLPKVPSFEVESRKITERITTQNKTFTDWKDLIRSTESFDEISSQITMFILYFLKAPYSYDEQKFKGMASSLYSNTVYSDIPKHTVDTFFLHSETLVSADEDDILISESSLTEENVIPSVGQSNKDHDVVCNNKRSEESAAQEKNFIPYGVIEETNLNQDRLSSSCVWQASELMEIDENDVSYIQAKLTDKLTNYDDYSGIILSADDAKRDNIINLSFSGFTHYCSLIKRSPSKLALEPSTVGGVFGLLMYCPVGEYRGRTVFADYRYLSRDFFLDVMLRNGTLAVMCNLCLFMSLARHFSSIRDINNARSLGAAFCLLKDSDSVYPMRDIAAAAGLSKDNPSVAELLQCYDAAWDSAGYDVFCRDGMKRKYMYTADYENALSTTYSFRKFMRTSFDNMERKSYLKLSFAYDLYKLGFVPKTGRLVALSCSPPLSGAGETGERKYFYTVLLHYVLTHNDIRVRDWHLVSLGPDGITLHVETNDRYALETVLDALESAYTSAAKISSFNVPEIEIKRMVI